MGMSADAHLAYGYDLGSGEDFKAAERGEYGEPKLPWLTDDDEEGEHDDFEDAATKLLLASAGFTEEWAPEAAEGGYYDRKRVAEERHGIDFDYSGHSDYVGWMLIAQGSERSVEWDEAMALDLAELAALPGHHGWDEKLAAALKTLGITPTQDGPKWLVYPSYG